MKLFPPHFRKVASVLTATGTLSFLAACNEAPDDDVQDAREEVQEQREDVQEEKADLQEAKQDLEEAKAATAAPDTPVAPSTTMGDMPESPSERPMTDSGTMTPGTPGAPPTPTPPATPAEPQTPAPGGTM